MRSLGALLRRKTFRTFFISFLLVFMLPLFLMAAAYNQSFQRAERELEATQQIALLQFKSGADSRLLSITRVAAGLLTDERTLYFAGQRDPLAWLGNNTSFTMLRSLLGELSGVSVAGNEIELCYIDFTLSERIFSGGVVEYQDFYNRKLQGLFNSYDSWREFQESSPDGFFGLRDERGGAVGYARTLRLSDNSSVSIVMILDANRIILSDVGEGQMILTKSGEHIAVGGLSTALAGAGRNPTSFGVAGQSSALFEKFEPSAAQLAQPEGATLVNTDEGLLRVHWVNSAQTGCVYFLFSSNAEWMAKLNRLRLLMIGGMIAALFVGAGLCLWFAWRSYQPIRSLRRFASGTLSEEETSDDFLFLQESFDALRAQKRTVDQHLRSQRGSLRRAALERLLRGRYRSAETMEEELLALDVDFASDAFFVVGAFPLMIPEGMDTELMLFALSNILKELLIDNDFEAQDVLIDPNLYILINPRDTANEERMFESLRVVLERGKSLAEKHFECEVAIVCSSLSHGFTGIRAAFEETNAAQRTPSLSMPDMRIAPDMPAPLAYNEERQLFTRTMQSGDALALRARLAEIGNALALEQTWRQDLHFALVVQSCEEAAALARPTAESVRHLLKKMYAAWSAEGLNARMAALAELAESVRASYERASNEGRGEAIAAKADAFIARRYDWQELGVAQVADHLRIGSSYASMLYKKQRGQSILDAINRVRLEHAKARLRDTDDSMADIASRVGYASGATFLRAFKKYEGVTPGQYRAATDINDNKK